MTDQLWQTYSNISLAVTCLDAHKFTARDFLSFFFRLCLGLSLFRNFVNGREYVCGELCVAPRFNCLSAALHRVDALSLNTVSLLIVVYIKLISAHRQTRQTGLMTDRFRRVLEKEKMVRQWQGWWSSSVKDER